MGRKAADALMVYANFDFFSIYHFHSDVKGEGAAAPSRLD